jgi:hypothetical protein
MKVAYLDWEQNGYLTELDLRKLYGVNCPRRSVEYEEDLVWTNITSCKECKMPHFGTRWRWVKAKSDSIFVPMTAMKAGSAPKYLTDAIRKLKRKIRGRSPATPHVLYHQSWYSRNHVIEPDDNLEFGLYCIFERFPKGHGPDDNLTDYFPESI